jgi:hypothetical protein
MLLLFSSGLRPGYMRNVLDCLCYPTGHVIHFRYRNELIETDSKTGRDVVSTDWSEPREQLEGLIVYADCLDFIAGCNPNDSAFDFEFFPVRYVQVLRPLLHGKWSYLPLVLGSYPRYLPVFSQAATNKDFNSAILTMRDRPRRQGHAKGEGYFVKRADKILDNILTQDESGDVHDAWEAKAVEISQTKRFKERSLFYRLDHLYQATETWPQVNGVKNAYDLQQIVPEYDPDLRQCIYKVRADVDFRLRVIIHQAKTLLPNDPKIKLVADPAIFTGETSGKLLADSPYNEESLFLRSKRATESSLTTVEFETMDGPVDMLAARPRLLIKIDPMFRTYLMGIAALLATGQLLLAANQETLALLGITKSLWLAFFKFLGFFFTLVGIGLAFRKMKIP